MRILVLTPTFLPKVGGVEVGIHEIYKRLGRDHETAVLCPDGAGESSTAEQSHPDGDPAYADPPYHVIRHREWGDVHHFRGQRLSLGIFPPFAAGMAFAAARAVRDFRPDIVHSLFAIPNGAAILAARRAGVPVVLSIVGADVPTAGKPCFWGSWLRLVARACARTTFISEFCRRETYGPAPPTGTLTLPFGVDTSLFSPEGPRRDRASFDLPEGIPLLLSLQRIVPGKRVDVQLRMMAELASRGIDACLVVAGRGPDLPALRALAASLGVTDRVRFAGFVPDGEMPALLRAADLFVYSSAFETFGITPIQAFACGLTAVAPANTALPETVRDGETGLLYPTSDARAFADRVERLLRDAPLRASLAARALAEARRRFDWDRVAEAHLEVFKIVLRGTKPRGV